MNKFKAGETSSTSMIINILRLLTFAADFHNLYKELLYIFYGSNNENLKIKI